MKRSTERARGQVLPIVLACLLILTIFVPLMVFFTQRDSSWAVKQTANTHAFHLAESGVEKSYLYISQSAELRQPQLRPVALLLPRHSPVPHHRLQPIARRPRRTPPADAPPGARLRAAATTRAPSATGNTPPHPPAIPPLAAAVNSPSTACCTSAETSTTAEAAGTIW